MEKEEIKKFTKELSRQMPACAPDAEAAIKKFLAKAEEMTLQFRVK